MKALNKTLVLLLLLVSVAFSTNNEISASTSIRPTATITPTRAISASTPELVTSLSPSYTGASTPTPSNLATLFSYLRTLRLPESWPTTMQAGGFALTPAILATPLSEGATAMDDSEQIADEEFIWSAPSWQADCSVGVASGGPSGSLQGNRQQTFTEIGPDPLGLAITGGLWVTNEHSSLCNLRRSIQSGEFSERLHSINDRMGYRMRQSEVTIFWLLAILYNDWPLARRIMTGGFIRRPGYRAGLIDNVLNLLNAYFPQFYVEDISLLPHEQINGSLPPVITHQAGQQQISFIIDANNTANIVVILTWQEMTHVLSLPDLSSTEYNHQQQTLSFDLSKLHQGGNARYIVLKILSRES